MFALLLAVAAQAAAPVPPLGTTGSFFAISVADGERSAAWYSRVLGVKTVVQTPKRDGARMIALEGDNILIELIENDHAIPLATALPKLQGEFLLHGVFKGGVIVKDWDALLARLKALDVPIAMGPLPPTKEQRAFALIRDPDGNLIQFLGPYAK